MSDQTTDEAGRISGLLARIRDLEQTLGQKDLSLAMVFGLPPQSNNLLGLLMAQPIVTDDMVQKLNIATVPKVALHRLREYMKPHEVVIHAKRIVGFWLDNDTKEAIRHKLRLAAGVAAVIELGAPHAPRTIPTDPTQHGGAQGDTQGAQDNAA